MEILKHQTAQRVLHWWTNVATTWNDPSLFGTADLVNGPSVGVNDKEQLVTSYRLEQNYPNPFNPSTKITYSVPSTGKVRLAIYDILGNQIALLVDATKNYGTYTVNFNAKSLSSGIYFYKLDAGARSITKKMILLK